MHIMHFPREFWAMQAAQGEDGLRRQMGIEFGEAGQKLVDQMRKVGIEPRQMRRVLKAARDSLRARSTVYNGTAASQQRQAAGESVKVKESTEKEKEAARLAQAKKRAARSEQDMPDGWEPSKVLAEGLAGGVPKVPGEINWLIELICPRRQRSAD